MLNHTLLILSIYNEFLVLYNFLYSEVKYVNLCFCANVFDSIVNTKIAILYCFQRTVVTTLMIFTLLVLLVVQQVLACIELSSISPHGKWSTHGLKFRFILCDAQYQSLAQIQSDFFLDLQHGYLSTSPLTA